MKCPACQIELKMAERQGVEIDYCSQCRGVWLDRGELDKIIERSATIMDSDDRLSSEKYREEHSRGTYRHDDDDDHRHHDPRFRKRRSFLGEFFDFD
ncbi:MAG: zf-TFIIB domain-containing protein [bacterium]